MARAPSVAARGDRGKRDRIGYPARVPELAADSRLDESLREHVARNLAAFAHRELAIGERRHAAVALALVADARARPCFVLTRRARGLRRHAGQWALPGGRLDPGERPEKAALRELHEEVALELPDDAVLGRLDDYATRSGFVITPVVVWGGAATAMHADPVEVAEIHRVPIAELERPEVPRLRRIPESERPVISLPLVGTWIHAPTAAILYQLREVALHGRPTRVDHFEQPRFAWR
jgi:8-oxo-dGTP pyrophosphatase MutT (NUDIX family)